MISQSIKGRSKGRDGQSTWNWQHISQKDNYTIPCLCTCLHILSENKWNHWEIRWLTEPYKRLLLTRWTVQSGDWNQVYRIFSKLQYNQLKKAVSRKKKQETFKREYNFLECVVFNRDIALNTKVYLFDYMYIHTYISDMRLSCNN